jgi:hypothetical protein
MRIISYDCAIKSLGVAIIDFDLGKCCGDICTLLDTFISEEKLINYSTATAHQLYHRINEFIKLKEMILSTIYNSPTILYLNVFDLIPGKKVSEAKQLKTERLHGCLTYTKLIAESGGKDIDYVLVEYQMNANDKSREVMNQIKNFYSPSSFGFSQGSNFFAKKFSKRLISLRLYGNDINTVKFKLIKPTLKNTLSFTKELSYSNICSISNSISTYKCNKIHCRKNLVYYLESRGLSGYLDGVKASNIDDVADAFMQAFAWVLSITF